MLSFDGTTLFVSDQAGKTIHVLKRTVEQPEVIAGSPGALRRVAPALAAATGGAAIPPPHWYSPYTEVVQSAREQGKPMLVYFRRDGVKKANDFEATVLKSADFNQRAQRYICVFEDVSRNTMTAYKFGAYRVPYVAVLDRNGGDGRGVRLQHRSGEALPGHGYHPVSPGSTRPAFRMMVVAPPDVLARKLILLRVNSQLRLGSCTGLVRRN